MSHPFHSHLHHQHFSHQHCSHPASAAPLSVLWRSVPPPPPHGAPSLDINAAGETVCDAAAVMMFGHGSPSLTLTHPAAQQQQQQHLLPPAQAIPKAPQPQPQPQPPKSLTPMETMFVSSLPASKPTATQPSSGGTTIQSLASEMNGGSVSWPEGAADHFMYPCPPPLPEYVPGADFGALDLGFEMPPTSMDSSHATAAEVLMDMRELDHDEDWEQIPPHLQ
eukprot:Rmarinus@m.9318